MIILHAATAAILLSHNQDKTLLALEDHGAVALGEVSAVGDAGVGKGWESGDVVRGGNQRQTIFFVGCHGAVGEGREYNGLHAPYHPQAHR